MLPATRLDTKRVPLSPQVMARALLRPEAQSSALKPGGSLMLPTGMSAAALGAGGWGMGASVESAMLAGCPCFHDGGAACCAHANAETRATTTKATASDVSVMRRMRFLPCEDR